MSKKSDKILEKILVGGILTAGAVIFGWMGYDTFKSTIEIEKEAKQRGISVYTVCKEKHRNDIMEIMFIAGKDLNYTDSSAYNSPAQPAQNK